MANSLVFNTRQYAAYVTFLVGQGDGTMIWRDAQGHIHIAPDPRPDSRLAEQLAPAFKQIEAGLNAAQAVVAASAGVAVAH